MRPLGQAPPRREPYVGQGPRPLGEHVASARPVAVRAGRLVEPRAPGGGPSHGVLFRLGTKRGPVTVYLKKRGKVHVSANEERRELILTKILAWTSSYNGGVKPVAPTTEPLPELPPLGR